MCTLPPGLSLLTSMCIVTWPGVYGPGLEGPNSFQLTPTSSATKALTSQLFAAYDLLGSMQLNAL